MDKIKKARYKFVRQTLESKDKDTQEGIRRILKHRAICIVEYKKTKSLKQHYFGLICGYEDALSELGIDIKRYGG